MRGTAPSHALKPFKNLKRNLFMQILKNRRTWSLLLFFILTFAVTALVSCGEKDEATSTYTIVTPSVNPGGTLFGRDFIMESAFATSSYSVEITGELETDDPGLHETEITVTDDNGTKRVHKATYNVRSYLKDSLRIEAGSAAVTVSDFINTKVVTDMSAHTFAFEDMALVLSYTLGTHRVGVFVDDMLMYSTLIIEDTVAPTGSPVTVYITNASGAPKASDFVTDIVDATSVACEFKEDYDFNTSDDIYVTVILTDEAGNRSEVTSFATCSVDTEPPVISGVKDITVTVGGSVAYKEGVTVTDNSGENLKIKVDNSRVNLKEVGTYEVSYSAKDSAGNETIVRATVNVIDEPTVSKDEMMAEAKKIYNQYIKTADGMSKWDIAYAIFNWTYKNIKYGDGDIDFEDTYGEAYNGFTTFKGDCFTYMVTSEALLEIAGIPTTRIQRLKYEGEANHFWLLVDIGDGWYHFDSCPHFKGMQYESFMQTDAELAAYCSEHDIDYYYRFDKSKYPARATVSYSTPEVPPETEAPEAGTPDTEYDPSFGM